MHPPIRQPRRFYGSNLVAASLCAVAGCLTLLAASPVAAQQTRGAYRDVKSVPDGRIGKLVTEIIAVVNANEPERTKQFIDEHFAPAFRDQFPMDMHLGVFSEVGTTTGGLEFYGVRKYDDGGEPNETVVIVRARLTGEWRAFVINTDPGAPDKIAGLQFAPARPPSDLPAEGKLSEKQMLAELLAYIEMLAEGDAFSGTVLLAKDGKVLFSGAYGMASKRYNIPNRLDTKLNLGSMNKMFTSVAILQLVERGKLALDDPISKYISSDWLPQVDVGKIQIKHLLTHTSGLGSYFNNRFANGSRASWRALDDYKPLIAEETLAFEPGTAWQYSNTGMFMLGVIIESVTGRDYFSYMIDNVHKPAGMVNTDCFEMDRPVPNLAMGYSRERVGKEVAWTNNLYKHVIKGGPAGGGFSTVDDLLKFDIALRGHKLLGAKYTDMLLTAKPELNSPDYGFGFGISGEPGNRIVGHSGGFPGISSNLDMFLDTGFTAAVLSNYDGGSQPVTNKIRRLLARLQ